MNRPTRRLVRLAMMALSLAFAAAQPAAAQEVLRDSETEQLFHDLSAPLIAAAGMDPNNVKIVLLNDPEVNAFTAGGQVVYVNSGLIETADNANELQGVIAHELGHVAGGHAIRLGEGAAAASKISILSLLLGIAATAAGAGEAGMGIMMAGQQAAEGNFLAFTRTQEATADAAGASYLSKAGISGKGSLDFFKKLQNLEYRLAVPQDSDQTYGRTHPLSADRIEALEQKYQADPAWNRNTDPALEARFERVKGKLIGYLEPKRAVTLYPESNQSAPAHYARAYAYHLGAYPDKAQKEALALLKLSPDDPFYNELYGQILLEGGHPTEAIAPLREAVAKAPDMPMISVLLGHALMATEDPKNFAEAKQVVKAAVNRDNDNPFAWYVIGTIYDREGDQPRAALASAEQNNLEGETKKALGAARTAMAGLRAGSADYLRAQDIAMVAEAELKKNKGKKKRDD